jgi:hypothetical protein
MSVLLTVSENHDINRNSNLNCATGLASVWLIRSSLSEILVEVVTEERRDFRLSKCTVDDSTCSNIENQCWNCCANWHRCEITYLCSNRPMRYAVKWRLKLWKYVSSFILHSYSIPSFLFRTDLVCNVYLHCWMRKWMIIITGQSETWWSGEGTSNKGYCMMLLHLLDTTNIFLISRWKIIHNE